MASTAITDSLSDFSQLRPGQWARQLSDGVRAVLVLEHWVGGEFTLVPGICCAWVPLMRGTRLGFGWPRTLKQTRMHLWVDHFVPDAPSSVAITRLRGERKISRSAREAAVTTSRCAENWWASLAEPEGVLEEARRQSSNRFDLHNPPAALVEAFTLARLGETAEASAKLDAVIAAARLGDDDHGRVRDALADVRHRF